MACAMFIAALSTVEKLRQVPRQFWFNAVLVVLCFVLIVLFIQKMRQMNKIFMFFILALILALLGVNWIYERNEPAFLTPAIDKIAPFLPSKAPHR